MPKYKHSENVSQKFYLVRCNRSSATPKWNQKLKGPYLLLGILMSHTLTFSSKSNNNNKKNNRNRKHPSQVISGNAYPTSNPPEVFLEKCVLKICSKYTGEHPCQSVISIKQSKQCKAALLKPHFVLGVLL